MPCLRPRRNTRSGSCLRRRLRSVRLRSSACDGPCAPAVAARVARDRSSPDGSALDTRRVRTDGIASRPWRPRLRVAPHANRVRAIHASRVPALPHRDRPRCARETLRGRQAWWRCSCRKRRPFGLTSPFASSVSASTAISTCASRFHVWLNGTSVAKARSNAAASPPFSNTIKRQGCPLSADGAQRAFEQRFMSYFSCGLALIANAGSRMDSTARPWIVLRASLRRFASVAQFSLTSDRHDKNRVKFRHKPIQRQIAMGTV